VVGALISHSLEYRSGLFIQADNPAPERPSPAVVVVVVHSAPERPSSGQVADQVARQVADAQLLRLEEELKRLRLENKHLTKRALKAEADRSDAQREHAAEVGELRRQQEADQIKSQATIAEIRKETHQAAVRLTQVKQELASVNARREREITVLRQETEAKQRLRQAEDELAEPRNSRAESYPRKNYGFYERVTRNGGERIPRE
jgi:hypothetical protein